MTIQNTAASRQVIAAPVVVDIVGIDPSVQRSAKMSVARERQD